MKEISRQALEKLIFGKAITRRFTQDSSILPDVWLEYGQKLGQRVDLLLTPHRNTSPGALAIDLEQKLSKDSKIAYNQTVVVATLSFKQLIQVILPMTPWWETYVRKVYGENLFNILTTPGFKTRVVQSLQELSSNRDDSTLSDQPRLTPEFVWMIKIVGTIAFLQSSDTSEEEVKDIDQINQERVYDSFIEILRGSSLEAKPVKVFAVARNRPAETTVWRSTIAIKADAARRVFGISCRDLCWAIIDSGIDARHPAFRLRDKDDKLLDKPFIKDTNGRDKNQTRILASYNFAKIRELLETIRQEPTTQQTHASRMGEDLLSILRRTLLNGQNFDWDLLEPLLKIPHDEVAYVSPTHEHGTHVAGILAGDWRKNELTTDDKDDLVGSCPDIRLYDLRVLDDNGRGDEFSVISALQFIRHLNANKEYTVIHGTNLSLSLFHDVANYACGCTPICEECERLIHAGVVVVAAAGNKGYLQYMTPDGTTEGYRSISITDPGNAEGVITVGATHSIKPHTFGVSYFSSRGPTGDGRLKPDLVAPGEKITSPVPGNTAKRKDGTSMAAPHVSGAAALLMARHKELIGKPKRVKDILCKTATDLGRERYFQGFGMVDVLRALQSV